MRQGHVLGDGRAAAFNCTYVSPPLSITLLNPAGVIDLMEYLYGESRLYLVTSVSDTCMVVADPARGRGEGGRVFDPSALVTTQL